MKQIGERKISEWIDECKRRNGNCYIESRCDFTYLCSQHVTEPQKLVSDPPRFTEAQMALLQWWYERGARTAVLIVDHRYGEKFGVLLIFRGSDLEFIGDMTEKSMCAVFEKEFPNEQRADLAELLGKDGESK